MLQIQDVSKSYGENKVIDNLAFQVEASGVHAISGPNGIGKSTLFRMIAGAELASAGRLAIDGTDSVADPISYRHKVSWAPEVDGVMPFLSPKEYFRMLLHLRGVPVRDYPQQLITDLNLSPYLDQRYELLSLGNKKKMLLIGALMVPFRVLLLDEACTGFDAKSRDAFNQILLDRSRSSIILLVNHDLEQLATIPMQHWTLAHEGRSQLIQGGGM